MFEDVGDSVFDPSFQRVTEGIGKGVISRGEGPTVFKSNTEEKWYLFIDEFGGRGYVPFETTDLDSGQWTLSPDYQLPSRPRHGTVLPVTQLETDRLAVTPPRVCTRTVTGHVAGSLEVSSGVTCLQDADMDGRVTVSGGASLVVNGGSVGGSLTGSGAGVVSVIGATLRGAVTLDGTTDWLRVAASRVGGRMSVTRSGGPVAPDLSATSVRGSLSCAGNATAPVLAGTTVSGASSGQCAR